MKKLLAASLLLCGVAAQSANIDFTFSLSGANETPPNNSVAAGGGIAVFDPVLNQISVSLFFTGLSGPATASHIHDGAIGISGPVEVPFVTVTPAATSGSIVGGPVAIPNTPVVVSTFVADLLAGRTYYNIHSALFPAVRFGGQLIPTVVPEPSSVALAVLGLAALALRRKAQS